MARDQIRNEISGGIFFSTVVQGRDITVVLPPELTPAMAGLRDASAVFTGRDDKLRELVGLLDPTTTGVTPRVSVVSGLPGVGKTELVLHAAHAAMRNGWFPGGVLFVDMLGYDPRRKLEAGAALESWLRAIGIPGEHIPPETRDRSGLFSSVLAKYASEGRPVLVIIDNAVSAAQVEPLIPPAGKAVVTSRHTLANLTANARVLDLPRLTAAAGVDLLAGQLDLSRGTDTRVAAEPDDALRIAKLCDGLPLALRIVASLLTAHWKRPLSSMAADLRDARTRLDEMRYTGADGDEIAVRSAFDLSYRQLTPEQAYVFRVLAVNLGPEISAEAAAAMTELDTRTVRHHLEELERAHLIETGTSDVRWRVHDLIRLYALDHLTETGDGNAAFPRLLAYYLSTALDATRHLDPTGSQSARDTFPDRARALAWLDAEYPNLVPFGNLIIVQPPQARPLIASLFLQLWRYFELRWLTDDWIRLTTHALHIARALEDRRREADALSKLGGAFRQARRFDEAISSCQDAAAIQRDLGDRHGEGIALNNLAGAQAAAGRYDEAIGSSKEAAAIFRETGDRHREAIALSAQGSALLGVQRYTESVSAFTAVVAIMRETGDRHGLAAALAGLGNALGETQQLDEAIAAQCEAADIMTETDDRYGAAMVLSNLSATLRDAGRLEDAIEAAESAVTTLRELGDKYHQGAALTNLGGCLQDAGQLDRAIDALRDAVEAYRQGGDPDGEAQAQNRLGNVLHDAKRHEQAITAYRAAAALFRETGDREREGMCLVLLGVVLGFGRIEEVMTAYRDAATIFAETGSTENEQRAREALELTERLKGIMGTQRAQLEAGQYDEVLADYQKSAAALDQFGDRHGHGVMSTSLGVALRGAGRFGQAIKVLEDAAATLKETDDTERERVARTELEAARQAQRDAAAAAETLGLALESAGPEAKPSAALRAAIEGACRWLGPRDARLFRLLSANPTPDIATRAAAIACVACFADRATVLARYDELTEALSAGQYPRLFRRINFLYEPYLDAAGSALSALAGMRLITRDSADQDRWHMHPAVRRVAAEHGRKRADEDVRDATQTLLLLYYLCGASAASLHLDPSFARQATRDFPTRDRAITWLDSEYANLTAAVEAAHDGSEVHALIALELTRALFYIMAIRRRYDDAVAANLAAVQAARRLQDRPAEAVVSRNLGSALAQVGRYQEAITAMTGAIALYRDVGDEHGEGTTLTNLGGMLIAAEAFDQAVDVLQEALAVHRRTGHRYSEAIASQNLGGALIQAGRLHEAIDCLKEADRNFRHLGEHQDRAMTLVNLGTALQLAGRHEEAIKAYRNAGHLARIVGDSQLEDRALTRMAESRQTLSG